MRIGVIGVQGAVSEHIEIVRSLGHEAIWLRTPEEVDGFIIPGGESTTITKLMKDTGLWDFVKNSGKPILGTCAGLIVLAKEGTGLSTAGATEPRGCGAAGDAEAEQKHVAPCQRSTVAPHTRSPCPQDLMGLLNCRVNRNAFGRQRESFEAEVDFLGKPFHGVFIRAPVVEEVFDGCKVVATFESKIVGVEQGNIVGLAFHPELASDTGVHQYFLRKVMSQ